MKNIVLIIAIFMVSFLNAQILEPVKWTTSTNKISETEYELIATAKINESWHLYSQNVPEKGPIPTSFTYEGNENYLKKGNTMEDEGHSFDDPVFQMKIKYFEKEASFKQRIKLKTKAEFQVKAIVEFMACDDTRCLPPTEVDLVFNIN